MQGGGASATPSWTIPQEAEFVFPLLPDQGQMATVLIDTSSWTIPPPHGLSWDSLLLWLG